MTLCVRRAPLFLLALAACLDPVAQLRGPDASGSPDAALDAGSLDAGCVHCLPECPQSCEGADAGCGTWTRLAEIKPLAGCEATGLSLAVSGETVRVAYCSCGKARLAEGKGTQWTDEVVQDGCVRTALRTDPVTLEPRLLVEVPGGGLRLLERSGSAWTMEIPPQISAPAALVVDGSGQPHLVGVGQGALLHVSRVKKAWKVTTAAGAPALTPGSRVHLALGKDDRLAVAYSTGELRVAVSTDEGWESSTVASSGLPVGLGLDAQGRPQVLYLQQGLRYAVRNGGDWAFEPVEPRAVAGAFSLTGGCPRAAFVTDQGLSFVERTSAGWTGGVVQATGFTGLDEPLLELPDGTFLLAAGSPVQVLQR